MAKYSDWRSTSQESKGKTQNISHSSFTSQSYQMAFYTAIKRVEGTKTRTVNWHAAVKKMFCLWSGLEGWGKKRGWLKGEGQDGGQRGQFACSQNWINVHLFPQEAFPLYSAGQGLKKRHNYSDGIQSSDLRWMTSCSDWGSTCRWRCPARQRRGCGGGGGTPGRRRLPSSWTASPTSPFTSPPSQPASLPPSLQDNWTQVWCSCTGFTCCRSERCPVSESWGSTDAGGSSARARTLCHSHTELQIHHQRHRGFPVKVVQPRKPQK